MSKQVKVLVKNAKGEVWAEGRGALAVLEARTQVRTWNANHKDSSDHPLRVEVVR